MIHSSRIVSVTLVLAISIVVGTAGSAVALRPLVFHNMFNLDRAGGAAANNVCGLVDSSLIANAGVTGPGASSNPIGSSAVELSSCQWGAPSASLSNRILVVTIERPLQLNGTFRARFEKDAPGQPVKLGDFARIYSQSNTVLVYVWTNSLGIQIGLVGKTAFKQSSHADQQVLAIAHQLASQTLHIVSTPTTSPQVPPLSHVNSSVTVDIGKSGYSSRSLSLGGGDSVGFQNLDRVVHRVLFNEPHGAVVGCTPNPVVLQPGEAGICYFETPGTFTYLDPNSSSPAFHGTVTVTQCCTRAKFLSRSSTSFLGGATRTFVIQTSGVPHPTINEVGKLPPGLTFAPETQGLATISGEVTGPPHNYVISLSAANAAGPVARQALTIVVLAEGAASTSSGSRASISQKTNKTTVGSAAPQNTRIGTGSTSGSSQPSTTEAGRTPNGVASAPSRSTQPSSFPSWIIVVLVGAAAATAAVLVQRRRRGAPPGA